MKLFSKNFNLSRSVIYVTRNHYDHRFDGKERDLSEGSKFNGKVVYGSYKRVMRSRRGMWECCGRNEENGVGNKERRGAIVRFFI